MAEPEMWLIWSHEHQAWWAPDSYGYVAQRALAGRYSYEEACKIVASANVGLERAPNEAMVLDEP